MERTPPTSPSLSPLTRKSLRLERLGENDEGSESLVLVSKVGRAAMIKIAGGYSDARCG
jgi:hypothetical protein